ncbi:plantaricin C family lantibiotic [Staphylococcus equorum]
MNIMEKNTLEKSDVQITWFEEVSDQEFDDDVFGACSTNTFSLSDYWGNNGGWCTASHECMSWCK